VYVEPVAIPIAAILPIEAEIATIPPFPTEAILHRIVRTAVLTNPHSSRNRRQLARVRALLDGRVLHRVTDAAADLPRVLAELRAEGVEVLGINGGDGTIHEVLTVLAREQPPGSLPALALLPGGTTNMSARDVNHGPLGLRVAIERFLAIAERGPLPVRRGVIRVDDGRNVRCGFIFGMGAVIRGIEYFHERVVAKGARQEWATGLAVLRTAWGIARRERIFSEGVTLEARLDGETRRGTASIFLVSALERLLLGIRPFWGRGPGPLAVTWVADDARRFLRKFPALLRGQGERLAESDGYLSRRSQRVEVTAQENYTIDGEIYRPEHGHLVLESHGPLAFVTLGATP
jgi:diacylglycerol kinase (ATP)